VDNFYYMPLTKTFKGVLIQKTERTLSNPGFEPARGYFCQIVLDDIDDSVISFWSTLKFADDLGVEHSVEGFDAKKAKVFTLSIREWEGRVKRTLISVK